MATVKFPRIEVPDVEKLWEMYHGNPYFSVKQLAELFSCCETTACKIAKIVRTKMEEVGADYQTIHPVIDKDVLFELIGVDIKKVDRDYAQIMKFKKEKENA